MALSPDRVLGSEAKVLVPPLLGRVLMWQQDSRREDCMVIPANQALTASLHFPSSRRRIPTHPPEWYRHSRATARFEEAWQIGSGADSAGTWIDWQPKKIKDDGSLCTHGLRPNSLETEPKMGILVKVTAWGSIHRRNLKAREESKQNRTGEEIRQRHGFKSKPAPAWSHGEPCSVKLHPRICSILRHKGWAFMLLHQSLVTEGPEGAFFIIFQAFLREAAPISEGQYSWEGCKPSAARGWEQQSGKEDCAERPQHLPHGEESARGQMNPLPLPWHNGSLILGTEQQLSGKREDPKLVEINFFPSLLIGDLIY